MSKFTCLVLCLVAASISRVYAGEEEKAAFRAAIKPIIEECSKDHGVSPDDIESAKAAGSADGIKPCFLGCVYKKAEIINDKGEYDDDTALTKLKTFVNDEDKYAKLAEIGKKCASVNDKAVGDGDAGCERAAQLTACFLENKGEALI
uniref:Odorant binding protein n=1 Tax=Athetis dissimilis TaxID=1737331 RepID=A0A4D6Q5X9_ATHDI|nr:odorant binding protein [Athetis dissimilis]